MLFDPDVRAMIRLLGDLSGEERDLVVQRPALLAQLCELIDGDRWLWVLERRGTGRKGLVEMDRVEGGVGMGEDFGPNRCRGGGDRLEPSPGGRRLPTEGATKVAVGAGLTLTIRQIFGEVVSTIRISREAGRAPFEAREIKIAQIVLSEIPWLHEQYPDAASAVIGRAPVKGLAPRQQAVLIHWVDGLSSRAIAEKLRISPYTVQDYIKGIYKHYRVNCRAELLRQMTLGWEHRHV